MHQLLCAPGCSWRFLTSSALQHAVELHRTLRAPVGAAAMRGCARLQCTTDEMSKQASTRLPSGKASGRCHALLDTKRHAERFT